MKPFVHTKLCRTQMLKAALLIISPKWKPSKARKIWHAHTKSHYSVTEGKDCYPCNMGETCKHDAKWNKSDRIPFIMIPFI